LKDPIAFKTISTFCEQIKEPRYFLNVKHLAYMINDSWSYWLLNKNENNSYMSKCHSCSPKKKKSSESFGKLDILNSIVDLAHFYDKCVRYDEMFLNDFMADLVPLFEIIRKFFQVTHTESKLKLCLMFYNNLFVFKSNKLKKCKKTSSMFD